MDEEYKRLIEEINEAYFLIQGEKVVLASNRLAEYTGHSKDKLIGMPFTEVIVPEDRERLLGVNKQVIAGQPRPGRYETIMLTKDGARLPFEASVWYTQYQGQPALAGILADISERKRAQEALEVLIDHGWKYRTMIDSMPQKIFFKDTNSVYIFCNRNYAQDLGIEPEEISGKTDYELYPEEMANKYREDDQRIIKTGEAESIELKYFQHKEERIVQTFRMPVRDTRGKIIGVLGVFYDITERKKKLDKELLESEKSLWLVFECAPYAVIVMDSKGLITQANDQAMKLYGVRTKGEIIGKNGAEIADPHHQKAAMHYFHKCMDKGLVIEIGYTFTRPNGSKISLKTSAGRVTDTSGYPVGIMAITRDVTEENRLTEDKQYYVTENIKAIEDERRRLSRALHDDTIQELLLATHRLHDVIAGNCGHLTKRAQLHLEETRMLIEKVVGEVRRFISDLRPDLLDDMGLVPALSWLTDRLNNEGEVQTKLVVLGKERKLPSETELNLFRIAQEALSNVRRHAEASSAVVALQFGEEKITMSISDNGRGFKLPNTISHFARQQKIGLIGIVERVRLLDGKYDIQSSPRKGTMVWIEINS